MTPYSVSEFLAEHVETIEPLSRDVHLAYWNATISGRREDFDRFAELELRYNNVYADKSAFARIQHWRENGSADDPLTARQLETLYRAYLRFQIDPQLIERTTRLASEIVNDFNVYRAVVGGRELTSNQVRKILRESTNGAERREAWTADKGVGRAVARKLLELVRLRNEAARSLGFDDYYVMSLELGEQDEAGIMSTFDDLEQRSRGPFAAVKNAIDACLGERHGLATNELRPWHYEDPFFQEAPRTGRVDLDQHYRDTDILELSKSFYEGIGLEVGDILARSDLYEKDGKEQHAYCMDLDRRGDIRILANIENDETWLGTMLHELGHAVYDRYIDPNLPFLLRTHAHVFTTEAIAMLFGRLSKDALWIQAMTGLSDADSERIADATREGQRQAQLVFARWCQVMVRFERALYSDPDQDLNALWWDMVKRYQLVTAPENRDEPDWAAKIHMVSAPVYYHNYMLGELLASQLDRHIRSDVLDDGVETFVGRPEVGRYLRENVFAPGNRYRWDEMISRATGEALTPSYFVSQFVE